MSAKKTVSCRYRINEAFAVQILKEEIALRRHEIPNRGFVIARSGAAIGSPSFYDLVLEKTNASPLYRISFWVNSGKMACQEKYRGEIGEDWLPKGVIKVDIPKRENDRGYVVIFKLQNVTDANIARRYDEVVGVVEQIKAKLAKCNFLK